MTKPEVFSLEAANALIPRLRSLCEKQFELRAGIESTLRSLGEQNGDARAMIITPADNEDTREKKRDLVSAIAHYRDGWREVEDLGCVVKDPRTGLVDFFGQVDGRTVFFCWRYGEESIEHYHAIDEGVAGRKPIMKDKRKLLIN